MNESKHTVNKSANVNIKRLMLDQLKVVSPLN